MSVVKRRLGTLLPGISIFLDVDDLKVIGDLEMYVEQSGCILIFISRGYFYSTNCVREAKAVTEKKKPLVLLREDNLSKGSIPLPDSMEECRLLPDVREYVFNERPVIVWRRIEEHQLESLRQVAVGVLSSTPEYRGLDDFALGLHLPGELRLQQLELPNALTLYCSAANPGAKEAANELVMCLGDVQLTVTETQTASLRRRTSLLNSLRVAKHRNGTTKSPRAMMLLYLNKKTWQGADNGSESSLIAQVKQARASGIPLVMVHEADEARDGCEFGIFFQTA